MHTNSLENVRMSRKFMALKCLALFAGLYLALKMTHWRLWRKRSAKADKPRWFYSTLNSLTAKFTHANICVSRECALYKKKHRRESIFILDDSTNPFHFSHDHSACSFSAFIFVLNRIDFLTIFWVISQFIRNDKPG